MKLLKKIVNVIKRPEVYIPITMAVMGTCIYKIGRSQATIDILDSVQNAAESCKKCENCTENDEKSAENA